MASWNWKCVKNKEIKLVNSVDKRRIATVWEDSDEHRRLVSKGYELKKPGRPKKESG